MSKNRRIASFVFVMLLLLTGWLSVTGGALAQGVETVDVSGTVYWCDYYFHLPVTLILERSTDGITFTEVPDNEIYGGQPGKNKYPIASSQDSNFVSVGDSQKWTVWWRTNKRAPMIDGRGGDEYIFRVREIIESPKDAQNNEIKYDDCYSPGCATCPDFECDVINAWPTKITGVKKWVSAEDSLPDVTLTLERKKNNESTEAFRPVPVSELTDATIGNPIVLTDGQSSVVWWTISFYVDRSMDPKKLGSYDYRVVEEPVANYQTKREEEICDYSEGEERCSSCVTCHLTNRQTVKVTAEKGWIGGDVQNRPDVTLRLQRRIAGGIFEDVQPGDLFGSTQNPAVLVGGQERVTWTTYRTDLDSNAYEFKVVEETDPQLLGYVITVDNPCTAEQNGFKCIVTNIYITPTPPPLRGFPSLTPPPTRGSSPTLSPVSSTPPTVWSTPPSKLYDDIDLPRTGMVTGSMVDSMNDAPATELISVGMTLELPLYDVVSKIVTIPFIGKSWDVASLSNRVGLLEGFSEPGAGVSLLAAHNHLNDEETGPFLMLYAMKTGDLLFVRHQNGSLMTFEVYENMLIEPNGLATIEALTKDVPGALVLITCENETIEGDYLDRRVIFAKLV